MVLDHSTGYDPRLVNDVSTVADPGWTSETVITNSFEAPRCTCPPTNQVAEGSRAARRVSAEITPWPSNSRSPNRRRICRRSKVATFSSWRANSKVSARPTIQSRSPPSGAFSCIKSNTATLSELAFKLAPWDDDAKARMSTPVATARHATAIDLLSVDRPASARNGPITHSATT